MTTQFLGQVDSGPWDVLADDYHADRTCVSQSMISVLRASPAEFHGRFVDGSLPGKPQTDPMSLGSYLHDMIAGGIFDRWAVWTGGTRRGKVWDAFKADAAAAGKEVVTADQAKSAEGMVTALRRHSFVARALASADETEQPIRWNDPESGVACRGMPDLYCASMGVILDWKSTAQPDRETWIKGAANYGLHRQAAHYCAGVEAAWGSPVGFCFVVVGTAPPHDVHVMRPDDEVMGLGRAQVADSLAELARRCHEDDWRADDADGVNRFSYPPWAFQE